MSAAIRKLLGLRPDLELLIYDNDGVNFGVRLLDASAEGPAKCVRRRISFDLPFVIESFIASEVAAAKAPGYHDVDEFYREEPPKPHAETAEEVAWRTARDVLDTVFNCNGQGYGNMLDKLTPIITAAIKRERGEA